MCRRKIEPAQDDAFGRSAKGIAGRGLSLLRPTCEVWHWLAHQGNQGDSANEKEISSNRERQLDIGKAGFDLLVCRVKVSGLGSGSATASSSDLIQLGQQ